jgi:hypothetical protein
MRERHSHIFIALNDEEGGSGQYRLLQKPRVQATPSAPLANSGGGGGEKENSLALLALKQQQKKDSHGERQEQRGGADEEEDTDTQSTEDGGASANIPLMRIVMSKKQTKRPTTQRVIREGWIVSFFKRVHICILQYVHAFCRL